MYGYKNYKQILNKFKQSLQDRFGANLISLVLFGSVARGAAKQESEIDLLIILKDAPDFITGASNLWQEVIEL